MMINIELLSDAEVEDLLFKVTKVPNWQLSNTQSEHEFQKIRLAKRQQQLARQREEEQKRRQRQLARARKIIEEKKQISENQRKKRIRRQKNHSVDNGPEL